MEDKLLRLKEAYRYLVGVNEVSSQTEVASRMCAHASSISSAFNGNPRALTDRFLIRFNNAFGKIFNIQWLLTGQGEMLSSGKGIKQVFKNVNGKGFGITANGPVIIEPRHKEGTPEASAETDSKLKLLESQFNFFAEYLLSKDEQINRLISLLEKGQTKQ